MNVGKIRELKEVRRGLLTSSVDTCGSDKITDICSRAHETDTDKESKEFNDMAQGIVNNLIQWAVRQARKMHPDLAFSVDEMYMTNKDGTVVKLYVPLPWWVEGNKVKVNEYIFIFTPELTRETRKQKLLEAKELKFPYPELINASNVFIIYNNKNGRIYRNFRRLYYEYMVKIQHFYTAGIHLMMKGLSVLYDAITQKALFLKNVAEKVAVNMRNCLSSLAKLSRGPGKSMEKRQDDRMKNNRTKEAGEVKTRWRYAAEQTVKRITGQPEETEKEILKPDGSKFKESQHNTIDFGRALHLLEGI